MKIIYATLGVLLLTSCAQDMGHYVSLPAHSPCKMVSIGPNLTSIDHKVYDKLIAWIQRELPRLGYVIADPASEDAPSTCGEVIVRYSSQLVPPPSTTDSVTCVSTPVAVPITRYQLTLEIQKTETKENILHVSAEMESSETDQDRILSDMENSLYNKFLQVQGPESQVETKTMLRILPA